MRKLPNKISGLVGLLLIMKSAISIAQTSTFLPLQPEKLKYAQEVESDALAKKDTLLMAEAYYLYGKIHVAAHDYLKAKDYFIQSLRIMEKHGDLEKIGRLYLYLSELEILQARNTEALKYGRLAFSYFQRSGSPKRIAAGYHRMAAIYIVIYKSNVHDNLKKSLHDSVLYYCKRGERMAYELKDTMSIADASDRLGDFYRYQKSRRALNYYQIALKCYQVLGHKHNEALIMQKLATTHLAMSQPDKAYESAKKAETIYNKLSIRETQTEKEFAAFFEEYYRGKKDWQNAHKQLKILFDMERNQLLADRDGAVSRLAVEYETEKKEVQLKNQHNELELSKQIQQNQRRFLAALSILFLVATVATTVFYQLFRKNQRLSQQNATLVREQNHRVKNNLQLVSSLLSLQANRLTDEAAKTAVEESQLRIEVMAILQRKLYDGDQLAMVNMSEFIKELVGIVLQSFGYEQTEVKYDMALSLLIGADPALRIGLIINELVANASKYAFPQNLNPILKIECSLQDQLFTLKVTDNGPGFQVVENRKNQTFGMRLIQIQVQQLKGTYSFKSEQGSVFEMHCRV